MKVKEIPVNRKRRVPSVQKEGRREREQLEETQTYYVSKFHNRKNVGGKISNPDRGTAGRGRGGREGSGDFKGGRSIYLGKAWGDFRVG